MKISLCIALYNEFTNLKYAIDSTYDWVDEVVIVDGGSTDGTLEWLRSRGSKIRIISVPNDPLMFHRMKQRALDEARAEWILQLDADEEITTLLRDEVLGIVNSAGSNTVAYQIPRKNYFLGRFLMKGGVYPDYTIRLYQKGSMYFPCKNVHENVEPTNGLVTHDLHWLKSLHHPMNHYSDPTWSRYFGRWKRYCKAEAARLRLTEHESKKASSVNWFQNSHLVTVISMMVLPAPTFLNTYILHKGFADGWQGFIFHFMSATRWWGTLYYLLLSPKVQK